MSCQPCIDYGRACDGKGPVCGNCRISSDRYCSWKTGQAIDDKTSEDAVWPPSGLENSEIAHDFWADDRCRTIFDSDEEIRSLLLRTSEKDLAGHLEAAEAVLLVVYSTIHPENWKVAVEQYYKATRIAVPYCQSITATSTVGLEITYIGIAFSLLNIFERYAYSYPGVSSRYSHLLPMRWAVDGSPGCIARRTVMPCAIVRALIYHLALGSTFDFPSTIGCESRSPLSETYLQELQGRLVGNFDHPCGRLDSVQGVSIPVLDIVYRLSFFRYKRANKNPFSENDLADLGKIRSQLHNNDIFRKVLPNRRSHKVQLTELYRRTCLVLAEKILHPEMGWAEARSLTENCFFVLRAMAFDTWTPAIAWPLLILFLAVIPERRSDILSRIERLELFAWQSKLQRLLFDLQRLQEGKSASGENALFDILLSHEIQTMSGNLVI